jgi:uncharacterized protein (DUF488 family)
MMQSFSSTVALLTIGHSNLELPDFLQVLENHGIKILCDVRSRPGSYRFPQFNREPLEECLRTAGIRYEFCGELLGGRPEDPRAYFSDGRVNYEQRRKARDFQAEIERVLKLSEASKVALMCAEEDPLQCHRFLMICPALVESGTAPVHIRRGGELESQREAEDRLLKLHDLEAFTGNSLFPFERDSAVADALRLQAKDFAFRVSPESVEEF